MPRSGSAYTPLRGPCEQETAITLRGVRALVVEDEVLIAVALEESLQDLGVEVIGPYPSIAQARPAIGAERPDIAILDVNVRGEMVFPLAADLAAAGVPILFCTGYADLQLIPPEFSASTCLGKPCEGELLADAMVRALAQAALARSAGNLSSASSPADSKESLASPSSS